VVRTLSKAFGLAGLRIGYLIAASPTIKALRALKPIYEINHLNAAIAAHLLKKPKVMEDYVASIQLGRNVLKEFFARYKCEVYGQHTNTVLVRLPQTVPAYPLTAALHSVGWLIKAETERPLSNHLRITIGPVGQMTQLCQLVEPFLTGEKSLGETVRQP
jgi:histidinol-phosphate aminotransferase